MNAKEVAAALGGDASSATTILCPGPGHGPGDRSLSVRLDPASPDGFTVHSFCGDDWRDCRDHVRAALGLGRWAPDRPVVVPIRPARPVRSDDASGTDLALRIWNASLPLHGTLAERYLASRGLTVDDRAAESLRFHPALRFGKDTTPGMVALYRDLRTDKPTGIQRTFLDPEGRKLERWSLGTVKGSAVKLDGEVGDRVVVGEGVESSLAAREFGYRPCWALGSAGAIAALPVLGGIERLAILGETGDGDANLRATRQCSRRWHEADVTWIKPMKGNDPNDVLLAEQAAR